MNLVLKEPNRKILKMLLYALNGHRYFKWLLSYTTCYPLPLPECRDKGKTQKTLSTLFWPLPEVFFRAIESTGAFEFR